jgi:ABC-type Fe3+/spermidine/putrescine transport system ATPase subunit
MSMPATMTLEEVRAAPRTASTRAKPLVLEGISKSFGSVAALHPTTLEVRAGELLSLLGPSGCGKTTTLRLIAGFEYPDTGSIRVAGEDISRLPPNRRGLGMVFQNYSLFPHLSVAENIGFGPRMAGMPQSERSAAVARMLDMIRLTGYGERRIGQLSGGQQQRVALARALVTNPSLLLLDEPLGALDKNLREGMQFELRRLQRELGITSVMVTHDQEEAMTMSDRIAVMSHGRVLQVGSPREVYEKPRNRLVAEFLGTANVLPASQLGGHGIFPNAAAASEVAIRPEKVVLGDTRPGSVVLQGVVAERVFKGNQYAFVIDVPGLPRQMFATRQSDGAENIAQPGDAVTLSFLPQDMTLLEPDGSDA